MKNIASVLLLVSVITAAQAQDSKAELIRGLKEHNRALLIKDDIWIRDPYIYLAPDNYYYLTGTTVTENDSLENAGFYSKGLGGTLQQGRPQNIVGYSIRVWRSLNLIDWEYTGSVFNLTNGYWYHKDSAAFSAKPLREWRLWAPEVYYENGKWMYIHTSPEPFRGGGNLVVTEGNNMKGPYTFPLGDSIRGKHDASLFKDDDGSWYLNWGNTTAVKLKKDFSGFDGKPTRIDPSNRRIGHEGATLKKIGNKYVHFGTAWSTDQLRKGSYNLYYCTSNNVLGPYDERKFVGRFMGHGTPFQDKEGKWWCTAFYNANVPPLHKNGIELRDLANDAQTINKQGVTLVPLTVKLLDNGELYIRAIDPHYMNPGPDEVQLFEKVKQPKNNHH